MKPTKIAVTLLLGVLLVSGLACAGGGTGSEPTPTPTPTTTVTVEATPTVTSVACPSPSGGKGNIAGKIVWNGKPWGDEFSTRAILKLYPPDAYTNLSGVLYLTGSSTAVTTADLDGNFCFHDLEPGTYCVQRDCPPGSSSGTLVLWLITVVEGQTYWREFDPYDICTHPYD